MLTCPPFLLFVLLSPLFLQACLSLSLSLSLLPWNFEASLPLSLETAIFILNDRLSLSTTSKKRSNSQTVEESKVYLFFSRNIKVFQIFGRRDYSLSDLRSVYFARTDSVGSLRAWKGAVPCHDPSCFSFSSGFARENEPCS